MEASTAGVQATEREREADILVEAEAATGAADASHNMPTSMPGQPDRDADALGQEHEVVSQMAETDGLLSDAPPAAHHAASREQADATHKKSKHVMTHARRLQHAKASRAAFSSLGGLAADDEAFGQPNARTQPKRGGSCVRGMLSKLRGVQPGSSEQKLSRRLKDQGVGDWWAPLLNSEAFYSTETGSIKHWHGALEELEQQLDPEASGEGAARRAIENLEHRGAVGETVLHAAILTYGAFRAIDPRKSERAFKVAEYLIHNFGPRQLEANQQKYRTDPDQPRTGVAIDLVNRSYYVAGDDQQYNGETALHMAIVYSDEELVRMLLEAGASLSARCYGEFFRPSGPCYYGELPLSFAASCGNLRIVYLLVDHVRNEPTRLAKRLLDEWDSNGDGQISRHELRDRLLTGGSDPNLALDTSTGSIEFAAAVQIATEIAEPLKLSRVTIDGLLTQGAREYCWVPPSKMADAPHGGFLYKFEDGSYRLFPCAGSAAEPMITSGAQFPEAMAPLCTAVSAIWTHLQLSLEGRTWKDVRNSWSGRISQQYEITLSDEKRKQADIHAEATHFVWAYQHETYEQHESDIESESNFLKFGGFVYYKLSGPVGQTYPKVIQVVAPCLVYGHHPGFASKISQIDPERGKEELRSMGFNEQKACEMLRKCGYVLDHAVTELMKLERKENRDRVADEIFDILDDNNDGTISKPEFEKWMQGVGHGDNVVLQQKRVFQLVTQVDCIGNTALHMSVIHKQISIFDWLLSPLTCTGCPRSEPKLIRDMLKEREAKLSPPYKSIVEEEAKERYERMKDQEKLLTKQFDANGDGKVSSREMQKGLAKLYDSGRSGQLRQVQTTHNHAQSDGERWAKHAVNFMDIDASGEIEMHEWSSWCVSRTPCFVSIGILRGYDLLACMPVCVFQVVGRMVEE